MTDGARMALLMTCCEVDHHELNASMQAEALRTADRITSFQEYFRKRQGTLKKVSLNLENEVATFSLHY